MHFWIDKRSLAGQRRPPSSVWSHSSGAKRTGRPDMAAPVHRYPVVPTAAADTTRRLVDPNRPQLLITTSSAATPHSASGPPLSASSASEAQTLPPASPPLFPTSDEFDCVPCCCVISSTVIAVLALTAVQMYLEHIFRHSSGSSKVQGGIIFLFLFLLVCIMFFWRLVLMRCIRRATGSVAGPGGSWAERAAAAAAAAGSAAGSAPGARTPGAMIVMMPSESDAEPPPYDEAVRLPAPPTDSPPPDYDKVSGLNRL